MRRGTRLLHTSLVEGVAVTLTSFSASLPTLPVTGADLGAHVQVYQAGMEECRSGSESLEAIKHVDLCSLT